MQVIFDFIHKHDYAMINRYAEEVGHVHMHTENISREPIGYNTKIGTDGVEWGRVNIWLVIRISFKVV